MLDLFICGEVGFCLELDLLVFRGETYFIYWFRGHCFGLTVELGLLNHF